MFSHTHEGFGNIFVEFSTCFVAFYILTLHEFFILFFDEFLVIITFVGENEEGGLSSTVHSNLFEPYIVNILKGFGIINIVDNDNSIGLIVVAFSDTFEPLLSSCIPNFHLDEISIDGNGSEYGWMYLNLKSTPMVEM